MRVQKIILTNPEVFEFDPSTIHSDMEALQKIASMSCNGSEAQKLNFSIRQSYTAICNLWSLGFRELAVDLAIDLIPDAEKTQNYKIAQDLCESLITHYYQLQDETSVRVYTVLFDKFTEIIAHEYNAMVLYETAINNATNMTFQHVEKILLLLKAIEQKLPFDAMNYHYYAFSFQSFLMKGEKLEKLYLDAVSYFNGLYYKHHFFAAIFIKKLVQLYLIIDERNKAENQLQQLEHGTLPWFQNYLLFVKALLENRDIYANDICLLIMENPNYIALPYDLKEAWKAAYKDSIRLLLES